MGDPERRTHCGPVGLGLVAKLVGNAAGGGDLRVHRRGARHRQRAGLDPALCREVLMGATSDSWQLRNLFPRVLEGDHEPRFTVRNLLKDLGHAEGLDERPQAFEALARSYFERVPPDRDYGAVARLFMDLPGE